MSKTTNIILALGISILVFGANVFAQSSAFTYQGKLKDAAAAANGTYEFEFRLFDAGAGGNQVGNTITNLQASVTDGIFAVTLDFGTSSFSGTARFLEVGVRLNGGGQPYTLLTPRQAVTSTPYAVRAINASSAGSAGNALKLGGVDANQFVLTTDPRLTQSSGNFIQNSTNQQASSNFNISGEGKADVFNAATAFNINNKRILSVGGTDNVFVGASSGSAIGPTGNFNAFVGSESGKSNTSGFNNSFVGAYAGRANTTGVNNAFFGANAGLSNNASSNSFFGANAGFTNVGGSGNSFFGNAAGLNNSSGVNNSFFGRSAGASVSDDGNNAFFGAFAGEKTTTSGNAFFGSQAGSENTDGLSNSFFGASAGSSSTTGSANTFVGSRAGQDSLTGSNNVFLGNETGKSVTGGSNNIFIGAQAGKNIADASGNIIVTRSEVCAGCNENIVIGMDIPLAGTVKNSISIGRNSSNASVVSNSVEIGNQTIFTTKLYGDLIINQPDPQSNTASPLCWQTSQTKVVLCSQSARSAAADAAEKPNGAASGSEVELKARLDEQNERLRQQQTQIEALKALVCQSNQRAAVCQ